MPDSSVVNVLFILGFGPIVRDAAPRRKLYADDLGLTFKEGPAARSTPANAGTAARCAV